MDCSNVSNIFLRVANSSHLVVKKMTMSSAYCIIGKSWLWEGIVRVKVRWENIWLTTDCKRSAAITKRRGERGSPYLTPHLHSNCLLGMPLSNTEEDPDERISLTHPIHLSSKPLCLSICKITSCSTVSKAFAKSSFRMMIGLFDCLHWWIYSKAQAKLS